MNLRIQSRRGLIIGIAGSMSILGVVVGFLDAGGATNPQLPFGAVFQDLPAALTSDGGTQLSQLTSDQISTVTVSPAEALSTAESFVGISAGSTVTEATSLGAFTDSGFKQKSPSGQYQLVASSLPCYVVTFSGLSLPVAMGSGFVSHDSVIVNAATGIVIEGIKFYQTRERGNRASQGDRALQPGFPNYVDLDVGALRPIPNDVVGIDGVV